MKFRLGACAAVVLLAACSGQKSDSQMAALHGSAGGDSLKSQARSAMKPSGRDIRHSIASAPDRGALMAYKNQGKPVKREGAFTYYPVAMSEDHALKGVVTGHMTVPMPDGSEVKLNYERHDEGIDGNWTWVGRVEGGDPMQEAIITFGEEAVFASIPQGAGKPPLNIRTQGGSLYAVQMDPSKVRSPNIGHNDMAVPEASTLRDAMAGQVLAAKAQVAQNAVAQAAPPTAANTIDVAIAYTAGFRNKAQLTQGSVTTALTYLLQVANQGFSNSNVNGYLRLVNALEVSYTDSNSNQTALYELTGSNGSANVAIPAALAPLRTARDQYGADIALLIRGFQQPEQQGCGIAWLIGANGAAVDPAQDARWGYGVVSFGDDTGTDGNSYYCAPESMVHEVGHLLGSAHDQTNSTSAGRYPYSYGYKSTAGNFYTIMAYGDQGQTPYRIFSNPNLTTCGGNACGVANSADNARSLNQTISVVSQFRAVVVPIGTVPSDFDGDGRSDIYWRNGATGYNELWQVSNLAVSRKTTVHREPDQNWTIAGSGDFNADGKADIIWRNSATGQLLIHHMNGATVMASSGFSLTVADLNWKIVAIADFDGDGTSDLYWRNISNGLTDVWLMGPLVPRATNSPHYEPSQAWQVVGSGDFNGDGRADILWRNSVTGQNCIHLMNGGVIQSAAFTDTVSDANWKVAAVGDFNRDGRADVYWRHSVTGSNYLWTMNGAQVATVSFVHLEPSQAWQIVSSGDYNGDGYRDVLWRNMATGQNIIHLMNGASIISSGQIDRQADTNWRVVN